MLRHKASILFWVITVLLAGCQSSSPFVCTDAMGCTSIAPGDPLRIGVLQALSGEQAPFGLSALRSIELVVDDHGGALLGHPIELQVEDSLCSKEGGATAAAMLTADPRIVGIIGPSCSGAAETAIRVVSEAGLVMISGSCSAPSLTSVGGEAGVYWRPGFLRTAQNDALSGRAAATFAFDVLGATRAATIDDGDPYTQGLAGTFNQAFAGLGGEVVLAAAVNKGDTNMEPVLTAVATSGAEMLFLPIFRPEGDRLVVQARAMEGLEKVILMGAEGLYLENFLQAVSEAGVGLYLVIPTSPEGPAHDLFVSRYEEKYGERPATAYYTHWYDAASLLLDAVEAVAVQERDGTLHIGRQALREALYATSAYEGLTGNLTCDEYGDCGVARFQVVRLDDPAAGMEALAANVVYTYPAGP
ncbi:MAG: branched-chain amino acid ABC transporter substrate-binding protein [Anaerolineae bacterium]|nr:branched-chain amino acid ABC transporter substrate-binding protein [Anaerolineae bacterium]